MDGGAFEETKSLHIALRNKHIELQERFQYLRDRMVAFGDRVEEFEATALVDSTLREERIASREKDVEIVEKDIQLCHMNVLLEDVLIENITLKSALHSDARPSV